MGACSSKKSTQKKSPTQKPTSLQQKQTNASGSLGTKKTPKQTLNKQRTDFQVSPNIFVSLKKGDIMNSYKFESVIGEGTYGKVSLVTQKQTGIPRAIKQIGKQTIIMSQEEEMISEVSVLSKLDHPNIVSIYELFQDHKHYYIVTEYLSGGELFEKLKKLDHFSESKAAQYMRQILEAVNYCHSKDIAHRDLKPDNILFESNKENANLKIVDFGTAKKIPTDLKLTQRIGTPYYIAPEVLEKQYDKKCDIWSCGVILYIMLCGYPPFNGNDQSDLYERIKQGIYSFDDHEWSEISQQAKDFIRKLLVVNPNARITAEEALKDVWITSNVYEGKISNKCLNNLTKFQNQSKLRAAIMQFMVTQIMSSQEKDKLVNTFKALDRNGDGRISREELIQCYMEMYHDEIKCNQMVNDILSAADSNNSQLIDYTEFVMASANKEKLLCKSKMETAFKMFDKDGNGLLTKGELQEIMGGAALTDPEWNNVFNELDQNGDGNVSFEEFTIMLLKQTS